MSRHGRGKAFLGKLAAARTGNPDHRHRAQAAQHVHRPSAADIQKVRAKRKVGAQLGEPSTAPDPMCRERKHERSGNRGSYAASGQPPAIRSRAPGKQCSKSDGKKFKNERQL